MQKSSLSTPLQASYYHLHATGLIVLHESLHQQRAVSLTNDDGWPVNVWSIIGES